MKLIISISILLLSYCNFLKNKEKPISELEKKGPEMLFLKLTWWEGDVKIIRNNIEVKLTDNLELEKEDLIQTNNGSAELMLGLNHSVKVFRNSEISITNLLTTEGDTASNISIFSGKILTNISAEEQNDLITLMTPNTQAKINNTVLFTELINPDSADKNCRNKNCNTKLLLFAGTATIKQIGKNKDIPINEKSQLLITNDIEITENNILALNNYSFNELNQILYFHSKEILIPQNILDDYKIEPKDSIKPKQLERTIYKIKKPISVPKKPVVKKPNISKSIKNIDQNRDKLKLDANVKF